VVELIGRAIEMGWPVLLMLVGLLIYFQASISESNKKEAGKFSDVNWNPLRSFGVYRHFKLY
jgi:hypothetical protein